MYTKTIPFKDYKGKARNHEVNFMLEIRDVGKNLSDLKMLFDWLETNAQGEERELTTEEVQLFYTSFENVLLNAWGVPSEDGLRFERNGRYEFEESKLFAACMEMFLTDPGECSKMLDAIMPSGMAELVKRADGNLEKLANDPAVEAELRKEIERLRAQIPDQRTSGE